jgi:cell surface protein SprA
MSFIALGSSFEKVKYEGGKYLSNSFSTFKNNRIIIAERLANNRQTIDNLYNSTNYTAGEQDGGKNGFGMLSQEVLIPSFMAAYGGIDPKKVTLKRFPSVFSIMPNWRISYDGLTKIPFIKKYARSVSLNHNYKGTYNIGNYVTNPEYDLEETLNRLRDLQNNFIPQFEVSAVSITEQFSPLFSIDINFLNSLSTRMEIKNSRNIVLSLTNNQLSENISKEFVFGAGYKIKDFQFIVSNKSTGQKGVNSDLNLRGDLSIRDNKMIIRRLTDDPDQATQGQKVVTIKISADYAISANFNLRVFYDRIVNTPFVTTSYPTANTNFGFSVRFSLTQ